MVSTVASISGGTAAFDVSLLPHLHRRNMVPQNPSHSEFMMSKNHTYQARETCFVAVRS